MASKPGAPRKLIEILDCSPCWSGDADREQQRASRCLAIPRKEWGEPGQCGTPYMGGDGEHGEPDDDGCPAGWYRVAFVHSFAKYRRGQHESPHLRQCTDRLVMDAVHYYEQEQARHAESLQ